jgi:hypothetical protein
MRKLRRRQHWLAGWLAAGRRGDVSAPQLADEVERLLEDLEACRALVGAVR